MKDINMDDSDLEELLREKYEQEMTFFFLYEQQKNRVISMGLQHYSNFQSKAFHNGGVLFLFKTE